jgi:hypothetical protein
MASGDTLFVLGPKQADPTVTLSAALTAIDGGSTPNEQYPVYAFDSASSEYIDFHLVMPQHYDGGGLTIDVITSAASTSNTYRFEAALRRIEDDSDDIETSHTYDYNGVTITPPTVVGEIGHDDITFTNGSDMDSVVAGDKFVLRLYRDHDHAGDTMAALAYLHHLHIEET